MLVRLKSFLGSHWAIVVVLIIVIISMGNALGNNVIDIRLAALERVANPFGDHIIPPSAMEIESITAQRLAGITDNMDVFGVSPFETFSELWLSNVINTMVLPSWSFTMGVQSFLAPTGVFLAMAIGALIAISTYKSKKIEFEKAHPLKLIRNQVLIGLCSVAAILALVSVFSAIAGVFYYYEVRGNAFVVALNEIEGFWQPNFLYNIRNLVGAFIILAGFVIFGILVGNAFNNALAAALFVFFVNSTMLWPVALDIILPSYYMTGALAHFMLPIGIRLDYSGSLIPNLAIFILYLLVILAVSFGALCLRQRLRRRHLLADANEGLGQEGLDREGLD